MGDWDPFRVVRVVRLGGRPPHIRESEEDFLVSCGEEEVVDGVLASNGEVLRGVELIIKKYKKKMTVETIFKWLLEKLQIAEDLDIS